MFFVVSPLALIGRRPHHVDTLVRAESQLLVRGKPDCIGVSTWYEALSACLGCRLQPYVDLPQARDRQELQPDPEGAGHNLHLLAIRPDRRRSAAATEPVAGRRSAMLPSAPRVLMMNPTVDDRRKFVLDARHRYDQSVLCCLKAARAVRRIKVRLARARSAIRAHRERRARAQFSAIIQEARSQQLPRHQRREDLRRPRRVRTM